MSKRVSVITRLRQLPKIFRGIDVSLTTGLPPNMVSVYLSRWKKDNIIIGLGGRTDIFFNALCYGNEPWEEEAILELDSGAIQTGISPLHRHGWTTQIPQKIEVAIAGKNSYTSQHAVFYPRPLKWFKAMRREGLEKPAATQVPSLRPAWALADAWLSPNMEAWRPDPDDLDFFEMENQVDDFLRALQVLSIVYKKPLQINDTRDISDIYRQVRDQVLSQLSANHSLDPKEYLI